MKNSLILFVLCSLFIASTAASQTGRITVSNNVVHRNAGEMLKQGNIGGKATIVDSNIYGANSGAAFGGGTTIDSTAKMIDSFYKPNKHALNPAAVAAYTSVYKSIYPGWDLAGVQRIECGKINFGAFSLTPGFASFTLSSTYECGGIKAIIYEKKTGTPENWLWWFSQSDDFTEGNFEKVEESYLADTIYPWRAGLYGVAAITGCDTVVVESFKVEKVANCCPTVTWGGSRDNRICTRQFL
jgi:hypothetical protein